MASLPNDSEGVEGIPFKLIIAVVILALTIPMVWAGLESYDSIQTENNLQMELDFLAINIRQTYLDGVGNAQDVRANFKDGMFRKIERIEIGDSPDGSWSSIRYELSGMSTRTILIEDPNIPICNYTADGIASLSLGSGRYVIHLECRDDLDFDGDGNFDLYVEISLGG
jgi:hypothetical protein